MVVWELMQTRSMDPLLPGWMVKETVKWSTVGHSATAPVLAKFMPA